MVSTNVEKGRGRTQMGQFLGYFMQDMLLKMDDFGGQVDEKLGMFSQSFPHWNVLPI